MDWQFDTDALLGEIKSAIAQADSDALEALRIRYLGKKGLITAEFKAFGAISKDEVRRRSEILNAFRDEVEGLIKARAIKLKDKANKERLQSERIDVSLPGRRRHKGSLHPLTLTIRRIREFFINAGFSEVDGPEIEDEHHNFTALNIPENHPARAMHDTFYFGDGRLLRTHTSPVQIRAMARMKPPLRIIAPGRVYRCDADATHSPMFHQIEGLYIDKDVSFANLKHTVNQFLRTFFESDIKVRFRPSYFPFTEPSAEVDIYYETNKGGDWLEVMGCGIVHPNVLATAGYDAKKLSGYAFGLGVERLAMLRYGIADLRQFFVNDMSLLEQFSDEL